MSLAFLAVMGSPAYAQNVVVQGNRRVDAETIRSYATGPSGEQIRQDLARDGPVFQRERQPARRADVVSVKENEVVNRVVFQGNKKLKSEQLEPGGAVQGSRPVQPGRWSMPTSSG